MFLAIDPGETTGWATFSQSGELEDFGQIAGFETFVVWLEKLRPVPELIICENYILNPKIPQGGSEMWTSQVIGVVRVYGIRHGIIVEMQRNVCLSPGYAFAGIKPLPKSRHAESHQFDAVAHGTYYLVKNKIAPTALEKKIRNQNKKVANDLH